MAFEGFPEELMTLILLKLPVKSLLRFKCVQKSWYSLIKSLYFIHLHRCSSSSTNSINYDCLIVRRFIQQQQQHVLSFFSYETLDDLGNEIIIPFSNWDNIVLSGSCDGVVCVTNLEDQIFICNPTIRESRSLFVPLSFRSGYHIDSIAFGSDPNTGQYTVVMIGVPFDYVENNYGGDREAWLYDFSTDTWRKMAAVFPPGPFNYSRCAIFFNGAFHWIPYYDNSILTFHISNEVTELIPLPDFVDVCDHDLKLFVSSKSQLSLIIYGMGRFEICVMTEYGVKESWTRLFKIEPLSLKSFVPVAFWSEQQLLLRAEYGHGQLVSYDLQHQNIRYFPMDGDFDVYPYTQSLVSVNGIGHSII